ncbi:uncharacterized protein LOC111053608 [Nilaparvata lugens]|uniref:uncharacterized protein LOC111053608 n=1 Tax=Nilaparvata lugens TaxID=108931 RepID=UPI00193DC3A8|nr:uncharacterized protein LOC111053608 [Nilaparvata lugens]
MEIHHFIVVFTILLTSKALAQFYPTTENPLQSCYKPYSCLNCTTARVCRPNPNGDGTFIDYKDFNCTKDRPFCDQATGSCSTKPSSDECEVDSAVLGEYVCMKDGVFPDPTSCKKYFRCKNLTSISFNCSTDGNDNYDAFKEKCFDSSYCSFVDCFRYNGFKRVVRIGDQVTPFFAYCIRSRAAVMDKCDGKYLLNETTQMCEPVCSYPDVNGACSTYTSNSD